jgi:hypothetical protein
VPVVAGGAAAARGVAFFTGAAPAITSFANMMLYFDASNYNTHSVDAMFYPEQLAAYDVMLGIGNNGADVVMDMTSDGKARLATISGTQYAISTNQVFFKDTWHYIALTISDDGLAVGYVNGQVVFSQNILSIPSTIPVRSTVTFFRTSICGSTFKSFKTYDLGAYTATFTSSDVEAKNAALGPPPTSAFGGPNLVSNVSDAVIAVSATKAFSVASHFNTTKLPGSTLKYFVTTNNHALLSVANLVDATGTFDLESLGTSGTATVTVKAVAVERDVDQWVATSTFTVIVGGGDHDPSVAVAIPDVSGTQTFDLTEYFTDADGAGLTYSLTVEDPNVVNATLVNSTHLRVQNGLFRDGRSLVTVTASDGYANTSDTFNATYSFLTFSFARVCVQICPR